MKAIYLAAAMGIALSSCNEIAEDERYIEVAPIKTERTVLLEDFTGQKCVNCPAAHRVIEALEQQYGSHLIAVSIHAGYFGIPASTKSFTGLMQEEGQVYNDRYGIEDYPQGVIDGKLPTLNYDQWATTIYNEIAVASPLSISLKATYDQGTKEIKIDCDLTSSENLDGNLLVWVIESGIVARQEDLDGRIPDYVHNNVFRACVNGIDGTPVKLVPRTPIAENWNILLKETPTETWKPENLAIVAFVKTKNGVAQAAKTNLNFEK